ncbi:hypothetical protein SAMN05518672_105126 [Chitinophaga sp. CF118]|nr:hypothetical protein SAMN05518672_105126 [Chitinophaga sp. CF118]
MSLELSQKLTLTHSRGDEEDNIVLCASLRSLIHRDAGANPNYYGG